MLKYSDIDTCLRALADPTRRSIMDRLSAGPASVSDLAAPFDMSVAAVMQHLQVLEACGLIKSEKVGRVRTCRLEPDGLAPLADWIAQRRMLAVRRFDRLGALLVDDEELSPPQTTPQRPTEQKGKKK